MEIQWLGHACFAITHQGFRVVIDPYNSDYINGYPKLNTTADLLLVSHEHYGHNYREGVKLSGRPASDCPFRIEKIRVPHDFKMGNWRGFCDIHVLEADGMKLVHMADIGTQLDGSQVSRLFGADVVMNVGNASVRFVNGNGEWINVVDKNGEVKSKYFGATNINNSVSSISINTDGYNDTIKNSGAV